MYTKYVKVDRDKPDRDILREAAAIIRSGGLVAFPTETVYGLGANGLDASAVRGIYSAKGRPSDNPLILHIARPEELASLVLKVTPLARRLTDAFWPGPLTVILPRADIVPDVVTGGLDSVAVRLPASPTAQILIELAQVPIAAPSANRSGRPSPTDAAAVLADLDGRIDMIVDAGPCDIGLESTVVDCTGELPVILRPGGLTKEMVETVAGPTAVDPALAGGTAKPRAPGMKYRHYAPNAAMVLVDAPSADRARIIRREAAARLASGKKVGLFVSDNAVPQMPEATIIISYGSGTHPETMAKMLFRSLRQFDQAGVDVIYAEGVGEAGMGLAIMNRLRKSCGYHILKN